MYYVYCLRRSHTYVDLCTVPTHVTCGKKNPHIFCKQPPSHQISNLTPLLSSPFPLLLFLLLTCDLLLISFHLLTLTRYVTGSFSSYSPFLHRTSSGALCCTHGFVLFRVFHTSRDYSHSRRLHHTIPDHIALSSGRYERSSSCCVRFFSCVIHRAFFSLQGWVSRIFVLCDFHRSRDHSHSWWLHSTTLVYPALCSGRYERSSSCCLRYILVSYTDRFSLSRAKQHTFSFLCVLHFFRCFCLYVSLSSSILKAPPSSIQSIRFHQGHVLVVVLISYHSLFCVYMNTFICC